MKECCIIGSGVAGSSIAYFLSKKFNITLIEKNNYLGGHTNTIEVQEAKQQTPIDTGFIVFNEHTYPNFVKFLKKIHIPYTNSNMSFSVQNKINNLEYNGSHLNGIFAQRKNLISPSFIKMLIHIMRFNKISNLNVKNNTIANISIKEYVNKLNLSDNFYNNFLIPMSSAVWSTPAEKMGNFPIKTLLYFFYNHGFLGMNTQYQWKTITGGSKTYIEKIKTYLENTKSRIIIQDPVQEISLLKNTCADSKKVLILTKKNKELLFDKVILACHANEALKLLKKPTPLQNQLLSAFKYQKNTALLHSDTSIMPQSSRAWSSWNYVIPKNQKSFVVYHMNKLQNLKTRTNYFVNLNGEEFIAHQKIYKKIKYEHPIFNQKTENAQQSLFDLNTEKNPLYFCGSYFKYGFHEDAFTSSVNLAEYLLKKPVL